MSNSITLHHVFNRTILPLTLLVLIAGCNGEGEQARPTLQLPLPEPIRQIAAIDGASLSLEVSVNNRTPVVFSGQGATNAWRVSIDVPASQNNTITVTWIESYEQQRLVLARQTSTIQTGTSGAILDLNNNYQTTGSGFDYDSDGVSNLAERQGSTNPLVADSGQFVVNEPVTVGVTGGCFNMGSPTSETGRTSFESEHEVCVGNYRIGKYEVTFEQYDQFALVTNRVKPDDLGWGRGSIPVMFVNWYDATDYAAWLSTQTGKKYRLLTEAEWEYAARAGTTTPFSTGNTISASQANYNARVSYNGGPAGTESTRSVAVGSYPANPWGIHDLHGNQGEWTCSTVSLSYSDGAELTCNPVEGNSTYAVRGGAWNDPPADIRSAARFRETPDRSYFYVGFRIAIGE